MNKNNQEDLDKRLNKFAIKGQEKLVGQLRQMLNSSTNTGSSESGESDTQSTKKDLNRDQLFDLMDSMLKNAHMNHKKKEKKENLYFEIICRPINYPNEIEPANLKKAKQLVSNGLGDNRNYSVFKSEDSVFYSRNITPESLKNCPNIFDPKVQSITIAKTLIYLGQLYQSLGLSFRDRFDIALRYSNASDLAVGSVSTETFLPSVKYKKEYLRFYVVRELHELLGQTAEISAEIIIEMLKKLRYQGIVNKEFFIHAISKHLAGK